MSKKVDLVIDLQYGSTGKGAICGWLVNERHYDTVVSANMPNAGHTYIDKHGNKRVFKALPTGSCGRAIERVMIGPGSVFSVAQLERELPLMKNGAKLIIHENAMVLRPDHATEERESLVHIASTMQGSAAAMIEKISRQSDRILAREALVATQFESCLVNTRQWLTFLDVYAHNILAEGSQGYSLGINTQFYPYTTSRDCSPAAFLSNMCIPVQMLRKVIGTVRSYPIRVGNIAGGYSGDDYPDQKEINWSDLGVEPERTTVTQRVRRVFTFSKTQINEAIGVCRPDAVFLNFCNYFKNDMEFADVVTTIAAAGASIHWTGWGPNHDDIVPYDFDDNEFNRRLGQLGNPVPVTDGGTD